MADSFRIDIRDDNGRTCPVGAVRFRDVRAELAAKRNAERANRAAKAYSETDAADIASVLRMTPTDA